MGDFLKEALVSKKKGFTLIELLVVVAIIALLISILLPSLSRARELAKRAVCGANLRGIGQGMHIYSNDNQGWFPQHFYNSGTFTAMSGSSPATSDVDYVKSMGDENILISEQTGRSTGTNNTHPSRSLFMLVIGGQSTVGSFICPSSNDTEDDLRNRGADSTQGQESAAQPGRNRFDFRGYPYLSYGYQVPYGRRGKPKADRDTRMAIAADKSPYFQPASSNSGNGTRADDRSNILPPTEMNGSSDFREIIRASNDEWRPYNSRNHGGEGQNVLYADDHVKFQKRPIVGVNNDNIYTAAAGWLSEDSLLGEPGDTGAGNAFVPGTNTDSYLVP